MSAAPEARGDACPVCRSPFRGRAVCPRCGADLRDVMRIRIAAWRLRNRARAALRAGDPGSAVALAGEATRLHSTPAGCALHALAAAVSAADTFARQRDRSVRVRFLEAEIARAERAEAEAIRARDEAVAECASQKRATGGRPGVEPTVRRAPRAAPCTWVHRIWSIWRRHRK